MGAFGTFMAMFFLRWIEMAAGTGKGRRLAFTDCVNMNRVQARSESLDIKVNRDSPPALAKHSHSDRLAILILEFSSSLRSGLGRHRTSRRQIH
jgi:hypothetical protein